VSLASIPCARQAAWQSRASGGRVASPVGVELELTRTKGDRRLYALEGVGTLRLQGFFSYGATAEAGGDRWRIARTGFWRRAIVATDRLGAEVGRFDPRTLGRGGALRWDGREFALRPASSWRERYAIVDGERELVLLDGKDWGRRPVKITIDDPDAVDAGLILFAAFVVRGLAEDAAASATVVTSGGA
jgi:hypothetical protein